MPLDAQGIWDQSRVLRADDMARKSSSRRAAARRTSARRTKHKTKVRHRINSPPARRRDKRGKAAKSVYYFGEGKADGNGKLKGLLGGKGANLAEMTRIGLPVPPGFTISTEVCTYFYAHHRSYPAAMRSQVEDGIRRMERIMPNVILTRSQDEDGSDTEEIGRLVAI